MIKLGQMLAEAATYLDENGQYDTADMLHEILVRVSQTQLQFSDGRPLGSALNTILDTNLGKQKQLYMENNPFASPEYGLNQALIPPAHPGPDATFEEIQQYNLDVQAYSQKMFSLLQSGRASQQEFYEKAAQTYANQAYERALKNGATQQQAEQAGHAAYQAYVRNRSVDPTFAPTGVDQSYALPDQFNVPVQVNPGISNQMQQGAAGQPWASW